MLLTFFSFRFSWKSSVFHLLRNEILLSFSFTKIKIKIPHRTEKRQTQRLWKKPIIEFVQNMNYNKMWRRPKPKHLLVKRTKRNGWWCLWTKPLFKECHLLENYNFLWQFIINTNQICTPLHTLPPSRSHSQLSRLSRELNWYNTKVTRKKTQPKRKCPTFLNRRLYIFYLWFSLLIHMISISCPPMK